MSYTKGPLRISCGQSQDGDYGIFGPGGILIGEAFRRTGIEDAEVKANARLWASAPDLAAENERLRRALGLALDALGCDRLRQDRLEAQKIGRAALNAAEKEAT